jgi:glutamyl-tRNA synthetase
VTMRYHGPPMAENHTVRVRFAPSPTGYLHLGSARTGLYNYIFARQHAGTFILRIEDTDLTRSTDEAIVQIISSMQEMGLQWDEGPGVPGPHGPYRQTERDGIYHEHVARLLETGHLYPCFCTPEELDAERAAAQAEGRGWVYSGKCRALATEEVRRRQAAGVPYTLRVRVPEGRTVFHDLLRGDVAFENDTMGDFIVQRSDGTVTYNLAVVVDDVTMEITHVIRGDDHISNTPKQVVIYEALGAEVPEFLHMPLLFGTDKKKLSKRHGATKLEQLTAEGFLVEVVRNYLCFLSAEFDETMITWSLEDLVRDFDVTRLGTSPSIFDPEKLRWMNGRYVRAMTDEWLGGRLVEYLTRVGFYGDPAGVGEIAALGTQALAHAVEDAETEHEPPAVPDEGQEALTREIAQLVHEKIEVLADFIPMAGWFFRPLEFTNEALDRLTGMAGAAEALTAAAAGLRDLPEWDVPAVETLVRELPQRLELKPKLVFAALRLGMSGQSVTPGLFESLWILGRDRAVDRLEQAAALLA